MPSRSIRRQTNDFSIRRSARIARYSGLIDDVTEAVIMQLSPKKRRQWGPEGRPKLTGRRPDGSPAPRRQLATAAAALAAAQAAADAVKAQADAEMDETRDLLQRLGRIIEREERKEPEPAVGPYRLFASSAITGGKIDELLDDLNRLVDDALEDCMFTRNKYIDDGVKNVLHSLVNRANLLVADGISDLRDVIKHADHYFNFPVNNPADPSYSPNRTYLPFFGYEDDSDIPCYQPSSPVF